MKNITKGIALAIVSILFINAPLKAQKHKRSGGSNEVERTDTVFRGKKINQVVYIDMGSPNFRSVRVEGKEQNKKHQTVFERSNLEIATGGTTSVVLENANPLKYTYSIDATPVSFFAEGNPFDTLIAKYYKGVPPTPQGDSGSSKTKQVDKSNESAKKIVSGMQPAAKKESDDVVNHRNKKETIVNNSSGDSTINKKILIDTLTKTIRNTPGTIAADVTQKVIASLKKNPQKTISRENARNIIDSVSKDVTNEIVKKSRDTSADPVLKKILTLWQKTRELYEKVLFYEVKCKAEDFSDAAEFSRQIDILTTNFDAIIEQYQYLYSDVKGFSEYDLNENQTKEFEFLQKRLPETITDLKSARNYLAGLQLHYYSLPIDVNGSNCDALQITVNRTSIKDPSKTNAQVYNLWIKGGVKIDASAGVFLTSLVDKQYYAVDVDSPKGNKEIRQKSYSPLTFGFGSMMDLSWRTGASWIRPSINFGVLFTTSSTQKFQLLSGIGLIIGKQQRGILHFGAAFGTTTTLQSGFEMNKPVNLGSAGTVPTDEKFAPGYYFGFTYNITKPKIKSNSGN